MALDQFMIAPYVSGLRNGVKPFLIPDDSFSLLKNAYVYRGRVRKRFGSKFITPTTVPSAGFEQIASRLRILLGTTDGSGNIASGATPLPAYVAGTLVMFSIGEELFTVPSTGTPVTMLTNSTTATTMDFNTTTGAYDIQGSLAATDVYYYPTLPVMGFVQYEDAPINNEPTYAFDTRMAYRYTATGWVRVSGGSDLWTRDDSHFFWAINYRGTTNDDVVLFVTNNSATDHVRYWDGTTWTSFTPQYTSTATDTIQGCRLIMSFHGRLLFLNTYESIGGAAADHHPNRIRYSQAGSPIPATGDAWIEAPSAYGKGGYIDADTKEEIISAKILRDRLIVFFERSTWEVAYTGNEFDPFIFQRINSELGVESSFSTVLFDTDILGVGNVGIHSCNGANVTRIDNAIPDEVFQIHNDNDGVERVCGIRDYYAEQVYWAIPAADDNPTYPNQVLVYNYTNRTWALNDDSITAFGYIQNLNDTRWSDLRFPWSQWNTPWDSSTEQSQFRQVIAGNQQGYTFILDIDMPRNAPALQVSKMVNTAGSVVLTVQNNNIKQNEFILIENSLGATTVSGIYQVIAATTDTLTINEPLFAGTYKGGATVTRVSKIDMETKEFNFYFKDGRDLYIPRVDFHVDKTSAGEISVDFFTSTSERSITTDGLLTGALLGTNTLETYALNTQEVYQERLWHPLYPQAEGQFVKVRFYLNDTQMLLDTIALEDFQLHAISFYSRRIERF